MHINHDPQTNHIAATREIDGGRIHTSIPIEALASWSELLGTADYAETLEAIMHVQDHGEPAPDPVTGENVWTDAYTLLQAREQAREREAIRANDEGTRDDPRSPLLRATFAAYNTVHQPIDGGECVMDRCRRTARERLGLTKEPARKTKATSRLTTHTAAVSNRSSTATDVLTQLSEQIEHRRREFLHSLTGNPTNPLGDTTPPEAEAEELDPFAATIRKYGGQTMPPRSVKDR